LRFDVQSDRLWLVGDLVNRGPSSLEVLRWCYARRHAVRAVLGNHDVYALARAHGATGPTADETLAPLLMAKDRAELVAWLGSLPVLFESDGYLMVHAGLLPEWDLATARAEARAVEAALAADPKGFLHAHFQDRRRPWSAELEGTARTVAALSVFTRLRFVDADGHAVPGSGPPEQAPIPDAVRWFRAPRRARGAPIVFGHWASLGLWIEDEVIALDSGCVWGGALTALRLEDRALFSVPARPPGD
jgi:bis(5'-nucleosyl)-tetraphosphatase (symmetrical)